jgi:hypothetical protein
MTVDFATVILPGVTLWTGALWFLWSRISNVREALAAFELGVAKDYVSSKNMRDLEDRLTAAIDRLGDRLDRRFEKP